MRASNVNKAMRFAPRTIKSACLILKKADEESKYAGTPGMASSIYNKITYVITAKTWHKKYKKYAIVFASTQLRITRLPKYPIDPKAFLGRCYINCHHKCRLQALNFAQTCEHSITF